MTNESRDQILSDFQDCTGLENMDECIDILSHHQWNLIDAIQAVHEGIGHDNGSAVPEIFTSSIVTHPPNNKRHSEPDDSDDPDQPRIIKTIPGSQRTIIGTSVTTTSGAVRDLHFAIQYCEETKEIVISDNESVHQLRVKISENFSLPPQKQHFTNWTMRSYDDRTILRDLQLPKENIIRLSSIENGSSDRISSHTTSSSIHSRDFPLTVLFNDPSGHLIPHKLLLQSNTTINELKKQIENLTQIPINQQSWQGLLGANDSDELHQTSLTPQANLIVHPLDTASNQQLPRIPRDEKRSIVSSDRNDSEQMDIDLETYEDDDVHILSQDNSTTTIASAEDLGRQGMIPDDCSDDAAALEHFSRVFQSRYNSGGPILFIGPLDQAIQESLYTSIHNRRPLAIYLHNDQSVCANVFCTQVLSEDSIVEYLANNYVFWAWDVTTAANRTKLFQTLRRCIGNQGAQRVGSMENDIFPLLLIVIRSRGSLELVNIIVGRSTSSEVLLNLIQSHESFEEQRLRDVDEELLRETRENLKKQQEDEYEQSKQADLAKERVRQEEEDTNKRLAKERLQQQQESKARLPEEPSESEKNLTRLKIRLPDDGGVLMRRFRINDNLQVLFDYLTSEGRVLGEYKLLTTYPKRDLTTLNRSETFEQLKLYPQEQLILESL